LGVSSRELHNPNRSKPNSAVWIWTLFLSCKQRSGWSPPHFCSRLAHALQAARALLERCANHFHFTPSCPSLSSSVAARFLHRQQHRQFTDNCSGSKVPHSIARPLWSLLGFQTRDSRPFVPVRALCETAKWGTAWRRRSRRALGGGVMCDARSSWRLPPSSAVAPDFDQLALVASQPGYWRSGQVVLGSPTAF
jgi:hypothetical protein